MMKDKWDDIANIKAYGDIATFMGRLQLPATFRCSGEDMDDARTLIEQNLTAIMMKDPRDGQLTLGHLTQLYSSILEASKHDSDNRALATAVEYVGHTVRNNNSERFIKTLDGNDPFRTLPSPDDVILGGQS